ncbi:MAG: ABC transporter permease, partial [Ornithinimicrobium sp.]|uniref:ABC transporter permease n=1 Tax=Ornithinimicrobium sp. TaxID=1977084 RepID=UPI003D9B4868
LALAGEERDPESLAEIREKYGLNDSLPVQYFRWAGLVLRGDLGESVRTGISVGQTIVDKLPITVELAVLSVLIAMLIGIPTGMLAAVRKGGPVDYLSNAFGLAGLSIPNFWLGLVLILLLAINVDLFPASGYVPFFEDPLGNLYHMALPAFVLGTGLAAVIMRQMRSSMLESLGSDYVRTARAKGLSEWSVVGVHAARNSLITVVTVIGLALGGLISGAVVTEQIFVIPGFGNLIVSAVFQRDIPMIQGSVLVAAAGYILVNLVVDILYSLLNPRIRISGGSE